MNKIECGKFSKVLLTTIEIGKLSGKLGIHRTWLLIDTLDYKIMDNPEKYNYRSHYRVLLAWNRIKKGEKRERLILSREV